MKKERSRIARDYLEGKSNNVIMNILWDVFEDDGCDWHPIYHWLETMKDNQDEAQRQLLEKDALEFMTPLHFVCFLPTPIDIIEKFIEIIASVPVERTDKVFRFSKVPPLHIACSHSESLQFGIPIDNFKKSCDLRTIKALMDFCPAAVKQKDRDQRLPLHYVCNYECDWEIVEFLLKSYPEGMAVKDDGPGWTPFSYPTERPYASKYLEKILTNDNLWKENEFGQQIGDSFKSLDTCLTSIDSRAFVRAVMDNLESKRLIIWLNKVACDRKVIANIMRDFYVFVPLISSFLIATNQYLLETDPNTGWAIALIPLAALLLSFEVLQGWLLCKQGRFASYLIDPWNWIELSAVVLTMVTARRLIVEESVDVDANVEITRSLLIWTGIFLLLSLISFLKKTFFSFSVFVGGVLHIFWELIPFLVTSAVVLFGFAYVYFVAYSGTSTEGFETLLSSFLTKFTEFLGGPDGVGNLRDIIFGIVTIVVLLNVVIAIVSKAWDDAAERKNAREIFWKYRLDHLLEVGIQGVAQSEILTDDSTTLEVVLRIERKMMKDGMKAMPESAYVVLYPMFSVIFLFGLLSFGYCWPMYIREFFFAERLDEDDETDKLINKEEKTPRSLVAENKELNSKLDHLNAEMENLKAQNLRILTLLEESTLNKGAK